MQATPETPPPPFDETAWWAELHRLNPWVNAAGVEIPRAGAPFDEETRHYGSPEFVAARKQACWDRWSAGRAVWNAWAEGMLALQKALEDAGQWRVERHIHRLAESMFRLAGECDNCMALTALGVTDFEGVTFDEDADFMDHRFPLDAYFRSAAFSGPADFGSAAFSDLADFRSAAFSGLANFGSAAFSGWADFESAAFSGWANFWSAAFSGWANFDSAAFSDGAYFGSAAFSDRADFESAAFSRLADFGSAAFSGLADFGSAAFSARAHFESAAFSDRADFGSAAFSDRANFRSAAFSDRANFESAAFSGLADFWSAAFSDRANFGNAAFSGWAYFRSAAFSDRANFGSAAFSGWAYFRSAAFSDRANFESAAFLGPAYFRNAAFSGWANFESAAFSGWTDFGQAMFEGATRFDDARFERAAIFNAAQAREGASFSLERAEFHQVPDFIQAHFPEAPRLDNVVVRERRGDRPSHWSGPWAPTLISLFTAQNDRDKAARWRNLKRLAKQGEDHAREADFFAEELKARRWVEDFPFPWIWRRPEPATEEEQEKAREKAEAADQQRQKDLWQRVKAARRNPQVADKPRRGQITWPNGGAFWLGVAFQALSGFGRSTLRPLAFWGLLLALAAGMNLSHHLDARGGESGNGAAALAALEPQPCLAGEGDARWEALYLSAAKGLVFVGFANGPKLQQSYACLYGITGPDRRAQPLPDQFTPIIPTPIAFWGMAQILGSVLLIFLLLLALRNHFRIR